MKRIWSFCMVLCMAASMIGALPMTVSAAQTKASGTCGENVTWVLDGDGTLTVSGEGDMDGWYDWITPWYDYRSYITSVVIEDGVTRIGKYALYGCASLTSVEISNSVTSIGEYVFTGCDSLTSIEIPNGVTSIGRCAFYSCESLKSITVDENNRYYTSTDGVLFDKEKTTLICYPAKKTNTKYEIPDGVTSIQYYAFSGCESLTRIEISDSVTSIGEGAFYRCESLTSVEIPDGVTSVGDSAFEWCSSLTSIEIPDGVTSIGDLAFADCNSLTCIEIPDSVTSIGASAFFYCESLTSIEIPDGVTSIQYYAFSGCKSLTRIEISDSVTSIGEHAFSGTAYYKNDENWENGLLYIGKHLIEADNDIESCAIKTGTKTVADYAFANRKSLTSIEIPDSVTSIGGYAFSRCSSLASIKIPDSVMSIGWFAFFGTAYYKNDENWENGLLYIGKHLITTNYEIENCEIKQGTKTIADNAFLDCWLLAEIEIPDSVTSIGDEAFSDCDVLTDVYYGGSEKDWNKINIGYGNEHLKNATMHFAQTGSEDFEVRFEAKGKKVEVEIESMPATGKVFAVNYYGGIAQAKEVNLTNGKGEAEFEENCENVKVFVWESLESMKPIK